MPRRRTAIPKPIISQPQYVKNEVILAEYIRKRFFIRDVVRRVGMHWGTSFPLTHIDTRNFMVQVDPKRSVHDMIMNVLNSQRDKEESCRIWIHKVDREAVEGEADAFLWFHRDIATDVEILEFSNYLEQLGVRYLDDAERLRRFVRRRRRQRARRAA